jgi:hypothetical protein
MNDKQIGAAMGVTGMTIKNWKEKKPAFKEALEKAREPRQNMDTCMSLLESRMSPKVRKLWDKLTAWQNEPNAVRKIEALLEKGGMHARQLLFVNALYAFSFNINDACRFVNIRRATFNKWVHSEPGFAELFDEVRESISDVLVSNLLKASNAGDVSATIFGCKTLARDRGFQERLEVEHTHKGSLAIEDMKLDKKVLRELRRALQERRETPSMGTRSTIESKARLISSTPIPDEDDDSDDRLDEDEEEEPLDNDEEELDTDDEPEDEEDE